MSAKLLFLCSILRTFIYTMPFSAPYMPNFMLYGNSYLLSLIITLPTTIVSQPVFINFYAYREYKDITDITFGY